MSNSTMDLYRGNASDGSTLSDQQLEAMERGGVVVCRGKMISNGYLLCLVPSGQLPTPISGIAWTQLNQDETVVPLGKGVVSAILPDGVTG